MEWAMIAQALAQEGGSDDGVRVRGEDDKGNGVGA